MTEQTDFRAAAYKSISMFVVPFALKWFVILPQVLYWVLFSIGVVLSAFLLWANKKGKIVGKHLTISTSFSIAVLLCILFFPAVKVQAPSGICFELNHSFRTDIEKKANGGDVESMERIGRDYISSYWAIMNGKEAPDPNLGENLEGRINAVQEDLIKAQEVRDKYLIEIADSFNVNLNSRQAAEYLDNNLLSAMKYSLRVPEYREGSEDIRLQISRERKLFLDTENAVMLMISSAQQAGDNPLPVFEAEAFKNMHETTKILAKKLLYSQMDERKIQRRNQKLTESCTDMTDTMRKTALKEMLEKKKEYMTVPAKNARCDMSLLCQSAELPADYIESAAEIERLSSLDIEMFNVPRVRMYGIPTVIFIPGQGLGTYDWLDHSLLLPAFPAGGIEKSISYALGTFRWDSDEDQKLRTPYGQIKDNRKKSTLAMGASFYKDYALYMTREIKGYRILPRDTHKVFEQMFKPKPDEN